MTITASETRSETPTHAAAPQPAYEAIAQAFAAEGVDHHFLLMGHGQMLWASAMDQIPGMRSTDARHEHCACMEAIGYHFATGKVGVASVTCGPGFTQVMTALTQAAQGRVPMVVLAADAPAGQRWYNQTVDQIALAKATGARVIDVRSPKTLLASVQEAFYIARGERMPVVLNIPYDLMKEPLPGGSCYVPSTDLLPRLRPMPPHPEDISALAEHLARARAPILLAGRGAVRAGAGPAISALADKAGALLSNTLPARGLFDDHPFSIGVAGGFSSEMAVECFSNADLVIAFGASLTHYTTDGGALFPNARVAHVDHAPLGLNHGRAVASLHLRGDARLTAEALTSALPSPCAASVRSDDLQHRIATTLPDSTPFEIEPGTLDPRAFVRAFDQVIPKDWDIVAGTGHSSYFYTHLRNRPPTRLHILREFGAIGSSLAMAIGVAAARGNGRVVLLDGDGGVLMHLQELEAIERQGIKLLVCVLNDGGYGAEVHKLRKLGIDPRMAVFGRPGFGAIAQGFKLSGETITSNDQLPEAFARYCELQHAAVWDIHMSANVTSPRGRKMPQ